MQLDWIHVIAVVAVIAAVGVLGAVGFVMAPSFRGAKRLNDRMIDQVTRSAELLKECSTTMGCGTAFGRLSTIR